MSKSNLSIKKYIYLISILLFIGIALLASSRYVFHSLLDNFDVERRNERNKIEIGEVIIENINLIERGFYNLFLVKSESNQKIIFNDTQKYFSTINSALDVIENGGVLSVNTNLHFEGMPEITEIFEYYTTDGANTLKFIKLRPKIEKIKILLSDVFELTNKREHLFKNNINDKNFQEVKTKLDEFSVVVGTTFNNLRDITNTIFYDGIVNLKSIEDNMERSKSYYNWLEQLFLLLISVIMILFSFIIVRKINKINSELFSAKQEIRTSLEELEETNAQLIQEIAEKRLAEEALAMSEHRLVSMWNSIHSGVILVRKDNHEIIDCNPAAEKMINLSMESIIGKTSHHFLCTAKGEKCPIIENELRDDVFNECFLRNTEGGMIPILKTNVPLEINAVEYYLVSFTDITLLKEAEKALLSSKEQAENADQLKSIFLAQMSHEIRTPINVMLSISSLLQMDIEDKLNEEQLSYFDLIFKSGNRITRTIDLLINLSEIQAGTFEPILKRFNLYEDVLSMLLLDYKKRAKDKNLKLLINVNTRYSILKADIYTVEQIFKQILDNAIIYTENGKITLTILRDSEEKLIVEIKDTGIGIEKEYFKDLFTPFTQEDMGYSRKFDGNGIGLSLVKSYCDLNNAVIEVESKKGIGSTFRVIFN